MNGFYFIAQSLKTSLHVVPLVELRDISSAFSRVTRNIKCHMWLLRKR